MTDTTRTLEATSDAADGTASDPTPPPSRQRASLGKDAWLELRQRPTVWAALITLLLMTAMALAPDALTALLTEAGDRCDLAHSKLGPSAGHPFGFDLQGCDYLAQVIRGTRPSLLAGLAVTAASLLIAVVLGLLSGFHGGWLDALVSRVTDIFFGLPFVLGATVILVAFPDHGLGAMILVLTVLGWTTMTRIMRSQVIALADADYVRAARMLGARPARLMLRHILPNAITPVIVVAMLNVGAVISGEATLDFLGVGLQYPQVSWGLQLNAAQAFVLDHPHLLLFPALFLSATVLSFILLGDALRDAFDPRLK
ncbi:ABC transporter permease [Streptomyces sp. ms191]|uniref:ABC transporter permease n=1 Tax=unclassified Streptomyces TaxID=2593676 RepID=UPI0011CDECC4|nr:MULTISPECIES: ABC transporter permease [unclassified Streptomyces]MCX5232892.1 ABC transporter permease [Streptomyces sp. NBC_00233]TXS20096.1 ABC transporter permease [Streptomyces sp. ms191]